MLFLMEFFLWVKKKSYVFLSLWYSQETSKNGCKNQTFAKKKKRPHVNLMS
jgi:hypothetical protein